VSTVLVALAAEASKADKVRAKPATTATVHLASCITCNHLLRLLAFRIFQTGAHGGETYLHEYGSNSRQNEQARQQTAAKRHSLMITRTYSASNTHHIQPLLAAAAPHFRPKRHLLRSVVCLFAVEHAVQQLKLYRKPKVYSKSTTKSKADNKPVTP